MEKLLGNVRYKTDYPINSATGFSFLFVPNTALIGVNFGQRFILKYPSYIDDKRFVFKGIEYKDPELAFSILQGIRLLMIFILCVDLITMLL